MQSKIFCDWPDCFVYSRCEHEHINEYTVKFMNEKTRSTIEMSIQPDPDIVSIIADED